MAILKPEQISSTDDRNFAEEGMCKPWQSNTIDDTMALNCAPKSGQINRLRNHRNGRLKGLRTLKMAT